MLRAVFLAFVVAFLREPTQEFTPPHPPIAGCSSSIFPTDDGIHESGITCVTIIPMVAAD